jgi:hypothetical protein
MAPGLPRELGILGSDTIIQGSAFASITGTGDISSGLDDKDIQGGLIGNDPGVANGGFGFGRSGFGPGGGSNTGLGTIGTGRYGTIGGGGTGHGYGIGGGRGGMHGRTAAVPQVHIGQPSAVGDLDKAIIRRYIRRNINKIQYCYEKELLAKPGLKGTVATQFFISPNGDVPTATASGVDTNVASCVRDVIAGIEFPKPKGGGGVQVSYPFTFDSIDDGLAAAPAPAAAPPPPPVAPPDVDAGAPPAPAPPAWSPFDRSRSYASDATLATATVSVQSQVQARLAAIDRCYGALAAGTLRAMIGSDGATTTARVGGLGTADVEACVAHELGTIKLSIDETVTIACDLSRGPEQAWRVSPDTYDVIEVSHDAIKHGTSTWPFDAQGNAHADHLDGTRDALILADPGATGAAIRTATSLADSERAALVAVKDRTGGAPIFLAAAPNPEGDGTAAEPLLQIDVVSDAVDLCGVALSAPEHAALKTPTELDRVFKDLATACAKERCGDAALINELSAPDAATLAMLVDRARAAGFTRIALSGEASCVP